MGKFITLNRLRNLHENLGWLHEYTQTGNAVGKSLTDQDIEKTELLEKLGKLNAERFEIMGKLLHD